MSVSGKAKLSREQRRDLDIEIGFLEGIARRDPGYVEALQLLGDDYTRRGRFAEGLEVDEHLARLRPDDPLIHFNLACSYALTRQPQAAFDALNRAIDHGYRDFRWISRDPDLAAFRKHRLYRRLRARIRAMTVAVR
jgi:tetratricopeptide (TPR) repeat protein